MNTNNKRNTGTNGYNQQNYFSYFSPNNPYNFHSHQSNVSNPNDKFFVTYPIVTPNIQNTIPHNQIYLYPVYGNNCSHPPIYGDQNTQTYNPYPYPYNQLNQYNQLNPYQPIQDDYYHQQRQENDHNINNNTSQNKKYNNNWDRYNNKYNKQSLNYRKKNHNSNRNNSHCQDSDTKKYQPPETRESRPHIIMTIKKNDPSVKPTDLNKNIEDPETFKIDISKDIDEIDNKVDTIKDIVTLGKLYENTDFKDKNYSVNISGLNKMIKPLEELDNLIGLETVKKKILDQIIFFSQDIHEQIVFSKNIQKNPSSSQNPSIVEGKSLADFFKKMIAENDECCESNTENYDNIDNIDDNQDILHTIIEGPPGVGKTVLGKILAKIYLSLGVTKNNKFRIVKRKDLIGEYLGHTAIKTQKVIDSCLGGVLFIDEAYSLGNGDSKKDSFSKECIDTLNQNLSENKGKFVCIIAGYKHELENDFFSFNPGLRRRFSFKYTIENYNFEELTNILLHKISKIGWKIDKDSNNWLFESKFLEHKMDSFPHFGGDVETWLLNCKIEHAKRVFGKSYKIHKILTKDDLVNGYKAFLDSRTKKEEKVNMGMYL